RDPLLEFGAWLTGKGILPESAILRRGEIDKRKSYFEVHDLGGLMTDTLESVRNAFAEVRKEPIPSVEAGDLWRHAHPPYPEVEEPSFDPTTTTRIQVNEALNVALDRTLAGGRAAIWGQDVGNRGGIFKVTHDLKLKYPSQVRDAPINEPLIIGTAVGAALHKELTLLPEIQFGDYSLNCLHWFVHMGNLYWSTNGQTPINVTLRTPVDPVMGGALYHSMSVDGFYGNIPGIVLTIPSCAYDAYGLLRTATDYKGPVIQLEPKRLYRMKLGPRLPGEPDDAKALQETRRAGKMPEFDDYRIPFGKAARRRAGRHLTVVAWGWAAWQAVSAANIVAKKRGIDVEVLDLRTLIPYDRDAVLEAARRTGKILIAQNDRTFAGFGREIQGAIIENAPGTVVRLIGQQNTPAVGQSRALEDATVLQVEDIVDAIGKLADTDTSAWLDNDLHWLGKSPNRRLR
ncbi:MAG: 2-oxoisovalerate dehydrogenase E1 component, partial [Myxococcota bacterium]